MDKQFHPSQVHWKAPSLEVKFNDFNTLSKDGPGQSIGPFYSFRPSLVC